MGGLISYLSICTRIIALKVIIALNAGISLCPTHLSACCQCPGIVGTSSTKPSFTVCTKNSSGEVVYRSFIDHFFEEFSFLEDCFCLVLRGQREGSNLVPSRHTAPISPTHLIKLSFIVIIRLPRQDSKSVLSYCLLCNRYLDLK